MYPEILMKALQKLISNNFYLFSTVHFLKKISTPSTFNKNSKKIRVFK